jgi:hypothetical protein
MNRFTLFMFLGLINLTQVFGQTPPLSIQAPKSVRASDGDYPESVKVSWEGLGSDATYKVFRSETPEPVRLVEISNGWQQASFVSDRKQLVADRRYYYRVKARRGGVESAYSNADIGFISSIAAGRDSNSLSLRLNSKPNDKQLVLSLQAVERDTVMARDSFFVAYAALNKENTGLSNIELRFFLSKDTEYDASDALIGTARLDELAPLSSQRGALRVKADAATPKGQYCVVLVSYRQGNNDKSATTFKKVVIR